MDLERLDRISLGVTHGGTVDKQTFQQILALSRRWLVEEKRVLELGAQITSGVEFLKQMAEELVKDHAENRSAMKLVKKYRTKLEVQLTQHDEWNKAANRQQNLIDSLLTNTETLYRLIDSHLTSPTTETVRALQDQISNNRI